MSDCGAIIIYDDMDSKHGIELYTHWNGGMIATILHKALSHKKRWDDTPYLTRIIANEMNKLEDSPYDGMGIDVIQQNATIHYTNGYITIYVDEQTITYKNVKMTFEEFVNLDNPNELIIYGNNST